MYKTKQQVDKHVSNILGRIRDENGRLQRGYSIAKMYYEIKEYELAKRYLYGFLTVKNSLPEAHKLMGQLQEASGVADSALKAYRRSLELDGKQKDVVLKVCELYSQTDVDPDRARYWAEQAEKVSPNHQVVFKLRERIISSGTDTDKNTKDLEELISTELLKRPRDVNLRIKLLKLYLDQEQYDEAYKHAMAVEQKAAYSSSLEWYQCLIEVLEMYQEEMGRNISYCFHRDMLHALNNLVALTLKTKGVGESAEAVHKFDQHVQLATTVSAPSAKEWEPFLEEMKAQLFYHMGTLLLKKPQKDRFDWGTATGQAAACYLVSYSLEAPEPKSPWFVSASAGDQKLYRQWCNAGAFRLSQVGHMLLTLCRGDNLMKWMNAVKQDMCTQQGRESIYEAVFTLRHMKLAKKTSFLMLSPLYTDPTVRFPSTRLLQQYDSIAHLVQPECLSTLVWIALQYYSGKEVTQPNYQFTIFASLQYNCPSVDTSSAESLCVLDTEAFLYATVWTAAMKQLERLDMMPPVDHQPLMLPLALCEPHSLCSKSQADWWTTAYQLYSNSAKENLSKMRLALQRGLEVIRMLGNHGLEVSLVVHMARTFEEMAKELQSVSQTDGAVTLQADHLHAHARLYWSKAVEMLDRMNRNLPLRHPKERLFTPPVTSANLDQNRIRDYLRNGKFFLACDAMRSEEHEKAIQAFEELNMPYASYHQAHVYSQLADIEFDGKSGSELTAEVRSKCSALLTKAKESYYLTMDRIRGDKNHKLHQLLPSEIEETENRIIALEEYDEPDLSTSQMNNSLMNGTDSHLQNGTSFVHSTPRPPLRAMKLDNSMGASPESMRHVRPSPERLEVQIRSMQTTQEKVMKDIMECNKTLLETNRVLTTELKENRVAMQQMKTKLDELTRGGGGMGGAVPPAPVQAATVPLAYYPPDYLAYAQGGQFMPPPFPPYDATGRLPPSFPVPPPGQRIPTVPMARDTGHVVEDEEDYEDDVYDGEDDYGNENIPSGQFQVKDSELIQEWPYGNITSLEGKSTVTYTPPRPMPGPGYFSQRPPGAPTGFGQTTGLAGPPPAQHFPSPATVSGASITMGTSNAGQFMTRTPVSGPPPNAVLGTPIAPRPGFPAPAQPASIAVSTNFEYPVPLIASGPSSTSQGNNMSNLVSMVAAKTGSPMYVAKATPSAEETSPKVKGDRARNTSYKSDGETDTSHNDPHYEPIMDLPDEVVQQTGEEEENMLYQSDRCKLYRFGEGQWKERGIGMAKILVNEATGRVRFLMRREQVLKICANHFIQPGMTVSPMTGSKNAFMWFAKDFADEEMRDEKFALKFKTEAMSLEFQKQFNEAINLAGEVVQEPEIPATQVDNSAAVKKDDSLLAKLMMKEGEWVCDACMVRNGADVTKCLACTTTKPGTTPAPTATAASSSPAWASSSGAGGFTMSIKSDSPGGFAFGGASSGFAFGTASFGAKKEDATSTSNEAVPAATNQTGFKFGGSSSFGAKKDDPVTSTAPPTSSGFQLGGASFGAKKDDAVTSTTHVTAAVSTPSQTGFKFGAASFGAAAKKDVTVTSTATVTAATTTPSQTGFKFGTATFGSMKKDDGVTSTAVTEATTTSQTGFTFGQAGGGFKFGQSAPTAMFGQQEGSPALTNMGSPASSLLSQMASKHQEETKSTTPVSTADGKTNLGGFSFTSPPKLKSAEEEKHIAHAHHKPETPPPKTDQPNPFAGFSFGSKPSPLTSLVQGSGAKEKEKEGSPGRIFGGNDSPASFSDLSKKATSVPSLGKPMEKTPAKTSPLKPHDVSGDESHPEKYEPTGDYQPIIQLPQLVDVQTGEEEEKKLFAERAKLYRYDTEAKQWKERGIGIMKIMKNVANGKSRVLMRREQVLKICANHTIAPDMSLVKMNASNNAWCWTAHDYADEEHQLEKFAVKFKSQEVAAIFKEIFENCQKEFVDTQEPEDADVPVEESYFGAKSKPVDLSMKPKATTEDDPYANLRPPEGSWHCDACLLSNAPGLTQCAACMALKPGTKVETPKPVFKIGDIGGFTFGSSSSSGFAFGQKVASSEKPAEEKEPTGATAGEIKPFTNEEIAARFKVAEGSWTCDVCLISYGPEQTKCAACETPRPGTESSGATGTGPGSSAAAAATLFNMTGGFKLGGGLGTGGFTFGAKPATSTTDASAPTGFTFGAKPGASGESASATDTFGAKSEPAAAKEAKSDPSAGFAHGVTGTPAEKKMSHDGFKFGQTSTPKTPATPPSGFNFGAAAEASGFQFGGTPSSLTMPTPTDEPTTPHEFKFGTTKTFAFTGVTPSGSTTTKSLIKSPKSPDDHYHSEEDDSHLYFEPIIPLPEKIEVKTGEEDEDVLFTHRAKLFRWSNNEWKERGLGNISILKHRESGRIRLIMRREQILKLCCNHNLTGDLKLMPMEQAKGKAYLWYAMDFTDGEAKAEKFCVRFKTEETALEFAKTFAESNDKMRGFTSPQKSGAQDAEADTSVANSSAASNFSFKLDDSSIKDAKVPDGFSFKSPEQTSKSNFSFGDRFSTPATETSPMNRSKETAQARGDNDGSDSDVEFIWEAVPTPEQIAKAEKYMLPRNFYLYEDKPDCPGCRGCIENYDQLHKDDDDDVQVIGELKASKEDRERAKKFQLPENFYLYEQKPTCSGCRGCESCSPRKDDRPAPTAVIETPKSQEPDSTPGADASQEDVKPFTSPGIGMSGLGMSFADVAGPTAGFAFGNTDKSKSFSWAGAGKTLFSGARRSGDDSTGDDDVVQNDDVHYDAIIPLPDLVEVKTGTEDEEPIYSHRAKVYKFDNNAKQWKERGVGEMKILKHTERVQYRVIMRREQVFKLACNHLMTSSMELSKMSTSETAWCWFAIDFSSNEASYDQLAVRFKTPALANHFKEVFLDCQQKLKEAESAPNEGAVPRQDETSESEDLYGDRQSLLAELLTDGARGRAPNGDDTSAVVPESVQDAAEADGDEAADEEDQENDDDYEDEEGEEEVMFEKKATLLYKDGNDWKNIGLGDLLVLYDDEVYGARIQMDTCDGNQICSHHIAMETQLTTNEKVKSCEWTATDFSAGEPIRRHFKAMFSSKAAVEEFQGIFQQGVEFAQAANISDHDLLTIPREIDVPEVVGQGQDVDDGAQQQGAAGGRAPLAGSTNVQLSQYSEVTSSTDQDNYEGQD